MKENKIAVIIEKPIYEVFDFTTNPQNTHLWVSSISEEVADEYPPKKDTKYRNRGVDGKWNEYRVVDFKKDETFILSDLEENYFVKYTYRKLNDNKTEMEYFEWMTDGELSNPFTEDILGNLKKVMEGDPAITA